jgi:hypothetical protein
MTIYTITTAFATFVYHCITTTYACAVFTRYTVAITITGTIGYTITTAFAAFI